MRWKRITISLILISILGFVITITNVDKWFFILLDPGTFEPKSSPAKPNYINTESWVALPTLKDDADVFLPKLPAIDQTKAPVDLFYIHPTTSVSKQWNAPINDQNIIKATARGGTLIQASAFNSICSIYAPRYRQATGKAYITRTMDGDMAIDLAYSDISTAFDVFLEKYNKGRPFILASHSQGSFLMTRLFREKIWGKKIYKQLVAVYLIGYPITSKEIGKDVPICTSETQTGCIISWNARGPSYRENNMEFENLKDSNTKNNIICVNPLTWKTEEEYAPKTMNKGALFFDSDVHEVLPEFSDAKCSKGKLLITNIGTPPRDLMSKILDWIIGPENYHPIEYQLFYVNIRENVVKRVESFLKNRTNVQ